MAAKHKVWEREDEAVPRDVLEVKCRRHTACTAD